MDNQQNAHKLEAILFYEGGDIHKKTLLKVLDWNEQILTEATSALKDTLVGRGITLIETDATLSLRTAPEQDDTLRTFETHTQDREIGKAGLEILSVLLYRGPSTQSEIDYIRGVNSSTTLRTLTIRGLIARVADATGRGKPYEVTPELLAHLGITSLDDLPERDTISQQIITFETARPEQTL